MKRLFSVVLVTVILLGCVSCGNKQTEKKPGDVRWPQNAMVDRLPIPETLTGEVQWESSDDFCVDLTNVTQEQFNNYVDACIDNGFTKDYYRDSEDFWAYDDDGYYLSVDYDVEEMIMCISIDTPEEDDENNTEDNNDENGGNDEQVTDESTTKKETTTTKATTAKSENTIDPDFKAAMDSYEKFMNEYVDFMKKYMDDPTDMGLLSNYATYMSKYADFVKDFEKWEEEDLNTAEVAYYLDVQTRVNKKLLEVAE